MAHSTSLSGQTLAAGPSADERPLSVKLRPDLVIGRQEYQGRPVWIAKDPLSLKFFRFNSTDYALLLLMDGTRTASEIINESARLDPSAALTEDSLKQFVASLYNSGLLMSLSPGQAEPLLKRDDLRRKRENIAWFTNVLSIRFRGINPEPVLRTLYPFVSWIFSPLAAGLSLALMVSAFMLVTVQFSTLQSRLPALEQFFSPTGALGLMLALAVTKVIHELGHGLTCRHFGGECHEMGVLILVLTPCLYCNVSDAWTMPSKWHRIAISLAGIWIDLLIASAATFLWWYSQPGMLNHFCLNLMFVCSVSTILFNANPLLRFDGYYVLSDLLEIPNLAQKSSTIVRRTLASVCLGVEPPQDAMLPDQSRGLFVLYAVAAFVYRWFITLSILLFLTQIFKPYGLQVIGYLIAVFTLSTMTIMPLWKLFHFLKLNWPSHDGESPSIMKRSRLRITACVTMAFLLFAIGIPLPRTVLCPLETQPGGAVSIYARESGTLESILVSTGQYVTAGTQLAVLSNPDIEAALSELTVRRDLLRNELNSLRRRSFETPSLAGNILTGQKRLAAVEKELQIEVAQQQRLTIVAAHAGTITSAPSAPRRQPDEDVLPISQTDLLLPANLGNWLEKGTLFCLISQDGQHEASLVINQSDIELVEPGQTVTMRLDHLPGESLTGRIERIGTEQIDSVSATLATATGGTVATERTPSGRTRPQAPSYHAIVTFPETPHNLPVGLRGQARIDVAPLPLAKRLWREIQNTLRIQL